MDLSPTPLTTKRNALLILVGAALFAAGCGSSTDAFGSTESGSSTAPTPEQTEQTEPAEQAEPIAEPVSSPDTTFSSAYHLDEVDGCPVVSTFIDVTMFEGPNQGDLEPWFEISCDDDSFTIDSNNIPHTEWVQLTPTALEQHHTDYTITLNPEIAAEPTSIGYENGADPQLGALGVSVSGVVWFGPTEAAQPDPYGDPLTNGIIDSCGGHHGTYHYHALITDCFFPDWDASEPSPIVAYALDGFPIYGPTGCLDLDCEEVVTMQSSYVASGSLETYAWDNVDFVADQGDEYLDPCNGRIQPDGSYGYHVTSSFPYIIGCFMGEVEIGRGPA